MSYILHFKVTINKIHVIAQHKIALSVSVEAIMIGKSTCFIIEDVLQVISNSILHLTSKS